MKLIIDIPEERLDSIKHFGIKQNEVSMLERALIKGTHFDSVIDNIKEQKSKRALQDDDLHWYREGINDVLAIIDKHIGNAESEDKE